MTIRTLLVSLLFLTSIFAWSQRKKGNDKNPVPVIEELSGDRALQAEATLIEAEKQLILENYSKAYELFLKAEELNPTDAAIKFKLAEVLVKNGENQKGLEKITKAVELDPSNKYYYIFQAEIFKALSDYKGAAKTYENLLANVPGNESYYLDLALIYKYQNQLDKSLEAFRAAEESLGLSEHIMREKQTIYLKKNDMEALKVDWLELIDQHPDQPEYLLELCTMLMANDLEEEAAPLMDRFRRDFPEDDNIYLLMSELERKRGDYRKALANLIIPVGSSDVQLTNKIKIINAYLPFIQTDSMRRDLVQIVNNLVTSHPSSFEALGYAGDVYLSLDSSDLALKYYRLAIQETKSNFGVWQNIVNLEYQAEEYDSLAAHSDQAIEYFPNQPIFYFYGGLAYTILKDFRKAVRSLEQGVNYTNDPSLKALFFAQLGDAYNSMKKHAESDENYEKALALQPNNDHVLNNYSYYLSLRGERLDKALEMSSRLVKEYPDNSTYLDTHGWVLFIKGDYIKAYDYLKKASELEEDGTIIEHYGDVLFKLGQVEEAINQWQRAKKAGGTTDQIDKKISDRQYYE